LGFSNITFAEYDQFGIVHNQQHHYYYVYYIKERVIQIHIQAA